MASVVHPELLEEYLRRVEGHLKCLPPNERLEILRELRSHFLDRAKGDLSDANVNATLKTLGDAREIALVNLRMRVAADHDLPLTSRRTPARLAILGGQGLLTLLLSIIGYAFAGCWLFTALTKPLAPNRVGLWLLPDATGDLSLSLGRHAIGTAGDDILGWWIIPIGVLIGIVCAVATYRFDLRFIRRLARPQIARGIHGHEGD